MEDQDIITLYWERSEEAVRATAEKYGGYCAAIIRRVLGDGRDAEEGLGGTLVGGLKAMPPPRPETPPPGAGWKFSCSTPACTPPFTTGSRISCTGAG